MALKEIKINPKGPMPEIDIMIGQAQFGEYRLQLGDHQLNNRKVVRTGNNVDEISDTFEINIEPEIKKIIKKPADLIKRIFQWRFTVAALGEGAGQLYFVRMMILQGGTPVENGLLEFQGIFENTENIIGVARFV